MHQFFFALDVVMVFCSLLLGVRAIVSLPKRREAQLIALTMFGTVSHILLSRHEYAFWIPPALQIDLGSWVPALGVARNMAPGLFMMLCHALFADSHRFPRPLLGLFLFQLFLEADVLVPVSIDGAAQRLITETVPSALQALFIALAVYWTVADWRSDLVAARRRIRALVLLLVGVQMLAATLLLRVVVPWDSINNYYVSVGLEGTSVLVFAFILFKLMDSFDQYLVVERTVAPSAPPRELQELEAARARLEELLEQNRIYLEPNLSLKTLADEVRLPEYKLRKLIHERLGYRNFNQFLHSYRIREACALLDGPERQRTPILTIALSVGYQSVNTFNRAFRSIVGVTPSEYRARAQQTETQSASATNLVRTSKITTL